MGKKFYLMSWYANDVCIHDTKSMKWYVVHKKVWPIIIYYQSMRDKTLKKNERNKNTYLIPIHFFCKFSYRVILSRLSFIQPFFSKFPFFQKFFNIVFSNTFLLFQQSYFFHHFSFWHSKIFFFLRKRIRHLFFQFFIFYSK